MARGCHRYLLLTIASPRARNLAPGSVEVTPRLIVNDFEFLDEAARSGLGIAVLPLFRCIEDLRTKRLRRVLPEWCAREFPLHAVYPSTRHLSPKLKAFLDHLREQMTPPPWEL